MAEEQALQQLVARVRGNAESVLQVPRHPRLLTAPPFALPADSGASLSLVPVPQYEDSIP